MLLKILWIIGYIVILIAIVNYYAKLAYHNGFLKGYDEGGNDVIKKMEHSFHPVQYAQGYKEGIATAYKYSSYRKGYANGLKDTKVAIQLCKMDKSMIEDYMKNKYERKVK